MALSNTPDSGYTAEEISALKEMQSVLKEAFDQSVEFARTTRKNINTLEGRNMAVNVQAAVGSTAAGYAAVTQTLAAARRGLK